MKSRQNATLPTKSTEEPKGSFSFWPRVLGWDARFFGLDPASVKNFFKNLRKNA